MYAVFDLETSVKKSFKRKANPFDPENYIVSFGIKYQKEKDTINRHCLDYMESSDVIADYVSPVPEHDWLEGVECLVGINLKFDLLYLWNNPVLRAFFKRGGRIYDVQYARYLVTAQQHLYPSMDQMAEIYGLPLKDDKIKAYWEDGYDTIQIPKDELTDYLYHDLDTTEKEFKCVAKACQQAGMVEAVRERMEGLCATIEMEYNGIYVDVQKARKNQKGVEDKIEEVDKRLVRYKPELPGDTEFNWNSGRHLSALLFGGTIPCETREQVYDDDGKAVFFAKQEKKPILDSRGHPVLYKSGQKKGQIKTKMVKVPDYEKPKTKKTTTLHELPGLTTPKPEWETKVEGVFKTDEDVLTELANLRGLDICKVLIERKGYDKELGTYYQRGDKGMLTLVQEDGYIHHKLNNCATGTTRLSSSDPNMQNNSRGGESNVVEMFCSRFGKEGIVAEVDYSSMEVVIQAWLTNDKNMIDDVNNGVDFHCKRLSYKLKEEYETILHKVKVDHDEYYTAERRKAKSFSFQRSYGAGIPAISKSTGIPQEEVKELADAENALYPSVAEYNERVSKEVHANAVPTELRTKDGAIRFFGWHQAPTGTRYGFTQDEAPDFLKRKGIMVSFSPTKMKNYSVQGEAGLALMSSIGVLWRHFLANDNYGGRAFLINTVHDCVWLDMKEEVRDEVLMDVKNIMEDVPGRYKDVFGIDIPVKFTVECEFGKNLKSMKEWEIPT